MASPIPLYGPKWDVAVTDSMASEIRLAAANDGITRSDWIRQACQARLDQDRRAHEHRRSL